VPLLPPALAFLPLLKLPAAAARAWPSSLEAVASGARSAVVQHPSCEPTLLLVDVGCRRLRLRALPLFAATIALDDVTGSFLGAFCPSLSSCVSWGRVLCGARCQVRVRGAGGGGWWRLKGCGNHEQVKKTHAAVVPAGPRPTLWRCSPPRPPAPRLQGFPAESHGVVASGAPAVTVRGCCFAQTAEREACMTYQVKIARFKGTFQYHFKKKQKLVIRFTCGNF
jgi:hypothetical protein